MITDFSVEVKKTSELPTIQVKGEIDIYTCAELRNSILTTIEEGHNNLILDLENIQYIDSTGLGTIAHAAQSIETKNGTIHVICTKPQIKKIFEVSGLPKKNITLYETAEAISVNKTSEKS